MIKNLKNKPFSLVLSGGGALAIAHLGVLHDLEAKGYTPSEVIGTSMGAIISACIAMGMKEKEIYREVQQFTAISKWIKLSIKGNSIIKNSKIKVIFEAIFKDKKMKNTIIPLKIITTNLKTSEKKVFSSQDDVKISDALLATMAIPGIFEEHLIDGEIYGDGFLCENLGLNEASYDTILAVDVLGKNSFEEILPTHRFKTQNVINMFEKSMRFMIYNQSKVHLSHLNEKQIKLIEPKTFDFRTFDFHKHADIRPLGLGLLDD
jgi:NTE family protein